MSTEAKKNKSGSSVKKNLHTLSTSKDVATCLTFPSRPPFWPDPDGLLFREDVYTQAFEKDLWPSFASIGFPSYASDDATTSALCPRPEGCVTELRRYSLSADEYTERGCAIRSALERSAINPPLSEPVVAANAAVGSLVTDPTTTPQRAAVPEAQTRQAVDLEACASVKDPVAAPRAVLAEPKAVPCDAPSVTGSAEARVVGALMCESLVRDIVERSSNMYISRCFDRLRNGYTACAAWTEIRDSVAQAFLPRDDVASGAQVAAGDQPTRCSADVWKTLGSVAHSRREGTETAHNFSFLSTASTRLAPSSAPPPVCTDASAAHTTLTTLTRPPAPVPIDEYCRFVLALVEPPTQRAIPHLQDPSAFLRSGKSRETSASAGRGSRGGERSAVSSRIGESSGEQGPHTSGKTGTTASPERPQRPSTSPFTGAPLRPTPPPPSRQRAVQRAGAKSLRGPTPARSTSVAGNRRMSSAPAKEMASQAGQARAAIPPQDALAHAMLVARGGEDAKKTATKDRGTAGSSPGGPSSVPAPSPRVAPRRPAPSGLVSIHGSSPQPLGNVSRERQRNLVRASGRLRPPSDDATTAGQAAGAPTEGAMAPVRRSTGRAHGTDTPGAGTAQPALEMAKGTTRTSRPRKGEPSAHELAFVTLTEQPAKESTGPRIADVVELVPEPGVVVLEPTTGSSGRAQIGNAKSQQYGGVAASARRRGEPKLLADGGPYPIPQGKQPWGTTADSTIPPYRRPTGRPSPSFSKASSEAIVDAAHSTKAAPPLPPLPFSRTV